MGGSIDMNVDLFYETSVSFLKSVALQLPPPPPKKSQSYANLNVVGQNSTALKNRQVALVFFI